MKTRGSWGWLLLAVALAAPLFIFYQRWSKVNKDKANEMSSKARRRLPEGVFPAGGAGSKMTNPIAVEEAGAAVPVSTAPAAEAPVAAAAPEPAAQAQQAPAPADAPAPAALEPAPAPQLVAAEAAVSTATPMAADAAANAAPVPALTRDPLLSPYDRYMLEQAELQRLLRQQELQPSVKTAPRRAPVSFDRTISLQGIISNSEGASMAIVNGEMVAEGGMVGPAKVVRITQQSVVFLHKNKKFIKYLSK